MFEILGAPWCDGQKLAQHLMSKDLPGIAFVPVRFQPTSSKHKGVECSGVHILVTDWHTFQPVRTGMHMAVALHTLFPDDWDTLRLDWLLKHKPTFDAILKDTPADDIMQTWQRSLDVFRLRRRPFLLYE